MSAQQRRERGLVETTSRVGASQEEVWARVTSPEGINFELRPWMRMTIPRDLRGGIPDELEAPARLGRSWVLVFGFLPFEYDDIFVAELEPGRRFRERSTMISMSLWGHERTVEEEGDGGTRVTDRITFELRRPLRYLPGINGLVGAFVAATFRHRHRRLKTHHESRG
jgi:ligand-binding SRPBCC domain-containing protein